MKRSLLHPLAGSRPITLVRSLITHCGLAPRYSAQVALMIACGVLRSPFCFAETLLVADRVAKISFDPAPIFIVGHWRSGTTFLHNLMSRDPVFCYPTILDALRPDAFFPNPFERISRAFLLHSLPTTRPMDDVPLQADLPQEDEFALASMGAPSFFNCFYFPQKMTATFGQEVLFENLPPERLESWTSALRFYLGKLSVLHPGRRLLLKNPAHSSRISHLRVLFPGAKFIHIHRDPTDVVASTRRLYRTMLPLVALQDYDAAEVDAHVTRSYPQVMNRLLAGLAALPARDVAEIRYSDLIKNPVDVLGQVYRQLELDGFEGARSAITTYANAHARAAPEEHGSRP